MEQMRDDVDCVKERVEEHDEKLHEISERMNQRDEDPYQRRNNQGILLNILVQTMCV